MAVAVLALSAGSGPAQAGSARDDLTRAEDYFLVADFGNALRMATGVIESGNLAGDDLRDAWVLRARCELASAYRTRATDSFCRALAIDPAWLPDRDLFTADEVEVFQQARERCPDARTSGTTPPAYLPPSAGSAGTPWYKKKLVWGAVGAAVVAGAVLAASGADDAGAALNELPPLPPPPGS
jgi:hypothetical protein